MNLDWNEVHKIIRREAQAEFERSVTGPMLITNRERLGHRIASRACSALLHFQQYLEEHQDEDDAQDERHEQQGTFHVPD